MRVRKRQIGNDFFLIIRHHHAIEKHKFVPFFLFFGFDKSQHLSENIVSVIIMRSHVYHELHQENACSRKQFQELDYPTEIDLYDISSSRIT